MNLNTATNEQLDEYRLKTASILKIDPFMLDYIWMSDPETGLKNRVLYAKRGAAEVLRQNLSISVESLVPSRLRPDAPRLPLGARACGASAFHAVGTFA